MSKIQKNWISDPRIQVISNFWRHNEASLRIKGTQISKNRRLLSVRLINVEMKFMNLEPMN